VAAPQFLATQEGQALVALHQLVVQILLVELAAALEVAPQAFLAGQASLQILQQAAAAAAASMRLLPKMAMAAATM